jgi:hypothetical protein
VLKIIRNIKNLRKNAQEQILEEPEMSSPDTPSSEDDLMINMFLGTSDLPVSSRSSMTIDDELRRKIGEISVQQRRTLETNVLEYWASVEKEDSDFYRAIAVILGAPATQVTVERAFNMLSLILTARRTRISNNNLGNILIVKLNPEVVKIVSNK